MYIDVSNVSISFEENKEQHTILDDVSLQVEKGEFICLLGPSGCGKSTLLNAVAGFLKPSSGQIKIDGQTVEKPSMKYVTIFQNYGLLPWRTVQKNVELGLETKKLGREEKKKITDHYLEMVGLKEAAKKRPAQLSGGMQQRAAIARALAYEPTFIMMDEPFAALDYFTREQMQKELLRVQQERSASILFVTHSIDEALILGSQIAVIEKGMVKALYEVKAPQEERNLLEDEMITLKRDIINNLHFI